MSASIQVVLADDHPLIHQGVRTLLASYGHIALTGSYHNGAELMEGLAFFQPDVLLLDIQLPDRSGDELVGLIRKKYPHIRILILTNFDSRLYVQNLLDKGVNGYLLKTADMADLVQAIETVHRGGTYIDPVVTEKMEQLARAKRRHTLKSDLTSRETEILQLIVNGQTDQEIATQLYLSLHTVKHYRTSILLKLDVKNTASLVSKALRTGLAE